MCFVTHSNTDSSEALKQSREETWAAKAEFDEYKACTVDLIQCCKQHAVRPTGNWCLPLQHLPVQVRQQIKRQDFVLHTLNSWLFLVKLLTPPQLLCMFCPIWLFFKGSIAIQKKTSPLILFSCSQLARSELWVYDWNDAKVHSKRGQMMEFQIQKMMSWFISEMPISVRGRDTWTEERYSLATGHGTKRPSCVLLCGRFVG